MSSFAGILNVARNAMSVSQAAVQIASHNIANANTAGYSRQREVLTANEPEISPLGIFGTGVSLATIQRARDALLDQDFRDSASISSGNSTRSAMLQRIEDVFGEPSDTGLAASLDAFLNAWSELAADPANASAKTQVQQAGISLTNTFHRITRQLDTLNSETLTKALNDVTDVNRLAEQIASINHRIVSMEGTGDTASDLRDQRDLLIDQLGKYANVRVIDNQDGSNAVLLGTLALVDGDVSKSIALTSTASSFSLFLGGSTNEMRNIGGELGALQQLRSGDIGTLRTQLDALAAALVNDVNTVHRTGWSAAAGTNVDFFDATPGNNTAARINLSATVSANAAAIAAGAIVSEPGDNSVALALAGLRTAAPSATTGTFGSDFRNIIGTLASTTGQVKNSEMVYKTLSEQADARRTAVFGVSVDEELIQVMRQQQSYAAASKMIKTVDEMMQTLLSVK